MTFCSLIALGGSFGCSAFDRREHRHEDTATDVKLTAALSQTLERDLVRFAELVETEVSRTADRIEAATDDRAIRRAALMWKLKILPNMQEDLATDAPIEVLVEWWTLWLRVSEYLQDGAGSEIFGQWQKEAAGTASRILREMEALGREYVQADRQTKVIRQINAYARRHPITGLFEHEHVEELDETEQGQSLVELVLGAPFRAVGKVQEGLDPTSRLSRSVDRFTDLMSDYPAMVRWQAQLLMLEIQDLSSVETLVEAAKRVADAMMQFSSTAEALPQELRKESQELLDDIDARQEKLQTTFAEARKTISAADDAMTKADTVTKRITDATTELTRAGQAWTETAGAVKVAVEQIQQFGKDTEDSSIAGDSATTRPSDDGRPFDVREYTQTAEAIERAAAEIRQLVVELNTFTQGEGNDQGASRVEGIADEVLGQSEGRMRSVVDHAFWRAVQFAGVVLVVAVAYRLITRPRTKG